MRTLLGISHSSSFFDITCHLGTSLALLIFFRKDVQRILTTPKEMRLYFFALVPLLPAYICFRKFLLPVWVGILFTSTLLLLAYFAREKSRGSRSKIPDVLFIGLMQGMALIPGVSRSGSTISAALFRGWNVEQAIRFSFLLSIPTIMGGMLVEAVKDGIAPIFDSTIYLTGFLVSLLTAFFVVRVILHITKKHLLFFAIYMGCLGLWVISR